PFGFTTTPPAAPGTDAASWTLKLTVAPETALGVYPIRVRTDDGLSNPILFSVGQLPQVAEAEDNSTFESAQVIPAPAVVEGQAATRSGAGPGRRWAWSCAEAPWASLGSRRQC